MYEGLGKWCSMRLAPFLKLKHLTLYIVICVTLAPNTSYSETSGEVSRNRVVFTGMLKVPTCSYDILAEGISSNNIDFGNIHADYLDKSPRYFSIVITENDSDKLGCSSLEMISDVVTVSFGDNNNDQIDLNGVITHGAGDGIRVRIKAIDSFASNNDYINSENKTIHYSSEDLSGGLARYSAELLYSSGRPAPGSFSGTVSVVIAYD
ncbi:hypothetical protein JCM19233_5534 [Vibrio astriarenae]|nr:hypothetical protein JCM19233_5534 [Vibrio sp. C7]